MLFSVVLAGFLGVLGCVNVMAVRHVGVMGGLVVVVRFVVLGGLAMMSGGLVMMLSGFAVVIGGFFGHIDTLLREGTSGVLREDHDGVKD